MFKDDYGITLLHVEEDLTFIKNEISFLKTRYSPEFL